MYPAVHAALWRKNSRDRIYCAAPFELRYTNKTNPDSLPTLTLNQVALPLLKRCFEMSPQLKP